MQPDVIGKTGEEKEAVSRARSPLDREAQADATVIARRMYDAR